MLATLVSDDAESGLGQWTTSADTGAFVWEASQSKRRSGAYAFWGRVAEGVMDASTTLALAQPVAIPAAGTATLSFFDWYMNEGDDRVVVEVSEDGAAWTIVYEGNRSALAPDAAAAFANETMTAQNVSLSAWRGTTVHLRFRVIAGPENRAGSTPMGWYVDDIRIESANWNDLATTPATTFTREGLTTGTYHYRVQTTFGDGVAGVPSPWSNIVTARVEYDPPQPQPDLVVASIRAHNNRGAAAERVTVTAVIRNDGDATSGNSSTRFILDGSSVIGVIATPPIAPGGTVEVTVQWDTRGVKDAHTITVTADETSAVAESDESNNSASATFVLKGGKV